VSPTAAATLASATGTPVDRIRVVPNPVDPARVVAEPVAHDGVRIAYLGQPFEIKGFPLLGPIIERVERDGVAFDLFLSAPPANLPLELRPPWDALFTAAEGRKVVLFGQQTDVRRIYAETDIVLCPSRNESFNRIAVEAMLNGIPVVASDLPAHRTLLGDEEAGLLFPVGEADAAAAALYSAHRRCGTACPAGGAGACPCPGLPARTDRPAAAGGLPGRVRVTRRGSACLVASPVVVEVPDRTRPTTERYCQQCTRGEGAHVSPNDQGDVVDGQEVTSRRNVLIGGASLAAFAWAAPAVTRLLAPSHSVPHRRA
jgi:hypothetical protein